jgi:hypothetical protein
MSYSFQTAGGEPVWDPALRVGRLYLGEAEVVAGLIEVPSGLTPRRDGTCDIDPEVFATFVEHAWRFYAEGRHAVLAQLLRGVLVVSFVLLKRSGGRPLAAGGEVLDALLAEAAQLERSMSK